MRTRTPRRVESERDWSEQAEGTLQADQAGQGLNTAGTMEESDATVESLITWAMTTRTVKLCTSTASCFHDV